MNKFLISLTALVAIFCLSLTPAFCQEFAGFSGETRTVTSEENCLKIEIPVEFEDKLIEGPTMDWTGPILDGGASTIYINIVKMPGVPSKTLFDVNYQQKKDDANYVEVEKINVKGPGEVFAFRCKEADHDNTGKQKEAGDIHRWHLFVFGADRFYTCGFTGFWGSFEQNKLQPVFEKVIKSFELISK